MAAVAAPAAHQPCEGLAGCPADAVALVLKLLSPRDVVAVAASCTRLCGVALDEQRVWRSVCESRFGQLTEPCEWLCRGDAGGAGGAGGAACASGSGGWPSAVRAGSRSKPITLYRELFPVLASYASFVGIWAKDSGGTKQDPSGALFWFRWAPSGVEVVRLLPPRRYLTRVEQQPMCVLAPGNPRFQAEVVDGDKCVLRDWGAAGGAAGGSAGGCEAAQAAACVAAGGSSPPGSAGFMELLFFMQSSVQKTRSGRRNRRSGTAEVPAPTLHHFRRVACPLRPPPRSHPHRLSGLWKGLYGPHGCELLAVSFDLTGSSALIVASKLTGDVNVPAGQLTWRVAAAPVPEPWPEQEAALVELRPHLVAAAAATAARVAELEAADEAAGNVIAAVMQQEAPPAQAMELLHDTPGGLSELQAQQQAEARQVAAWAAAMQARRVAAVHRGQGRVAGHGFAAPAWVEGRLWVYEDGSCGFVFMLDDVARHLIDLERLEHGGDA